MKVTARGFHRVRANSHFATFSLAQRGLRATKPIAAGVALGCLRCAAMSRAEWERLKFGTADATATADPALELSVAAAGALPPGGGLVAAALARELRLEAFRADFTAFNAGSDAAYGGAVAARPRRPLLACAFGLANKLSLINDGRAAPQRHDDDDNDDDAGGGPYGRGGWHARPNNCALVEVLVHEWPALVLITLVPIAQGEELLRSYGEEEFWRGWDELSARQRQVARASASAAEAAVHALAAPVPSPAAAAALPPPDVPAAAPPVATAVPAAAAALAVPPPAPVASNAAAKALPQMEVTSRHSGAASCGTDALLLPEMAPAEKTGGWAACGVAQLFKAVGRTDAMCALAAHVPPAVHAPGLALLDTLVLSGLTKGGDVAAALAPVLRGAAAGAAQPSARPQLLLLSPAAGADAASRSRFGRLVKLLAADGKAAFCAAAGSGGRGTYLVAGGTAFANAQLAAAATMPANHQTAEPYLLALVLPPEHNAAGAGAAATCDEAVPSAPPAAAKAPSPAAPALTPALAPAPVAAATAAHARASEPPATVAATPPAARVRDTTRPLSLPKVASSPLRQPPPRADGEIPAANAEAATSAALRSAAAVALAAASPPGALVLSQLAHKVPQFMPHHLRAHHVQPHTLRAELLAAPRLFELASQYVNGAPRVMVYLLRGAAADARGAGAEAAVTRVAAPVPTTRLVADYTRHLLAWLRSKGRWCDAREVLQALPPPVLHGGQAFLNARVAHLADDVATALNGNLLAALRDGEPPGPPPGSMHAGGGAPAAPTAQAPAAAEAASSHAQLGAMPALAAAAPATRTAAQTAPQGALVAVTWPRPPPSSPPSSPPAPLPPPPLAEYEDTSAAAEDAADALRTAAVAALLAATPPGTLSLQLLYTAAHSFLAKHRPAASMDALRAALAAAPRRFQLVPQFREAPRTAVYLLRQSTSNGELARVTPPHAATDAAAAYMRTLLAWLRARGRWCTRAEVLENVLPPVHRHQSRSFFDGVVAELADEIAVAGGNTLFAALRHGAPPGPPVAPPRPIERAAAAAHEARMMPAEAPTPVTELSALLVWGERAAAAALPLGQARAAVDPRPPPRMAPHASAHASAFRAAMPNVAPPPPAPPPPMEAPRSAEAAAAQRCATWGVALGDQLAWLREAAQRAAAIATAQQQAQQQRSGMPVTESLLSCCVLVLQPLPPPLSSVERLCDLLCFVTGAPLLATQNVDEWVHGARTQGVLVRFARAAHACAARSLHGQRLNGQPLWVTAAHRAPSWQSQQQPTSQHKRPRSPEQPQPHGPRLPWRP
jgi:hypothetical protein